MSKKQQQFLLLYLLFLASVIATRGQDYECERDEVTRRFVQEEMERFAKSRFEDVSTLVGKIKEAIKLRTRKLRRILKQDYFEQDDSLFLLDVTDLPNGRGRIIYDGTNRQRQFRRFWILENLRGVMIGLKKNLLNENATLTIMGWSFDRNAEWPEVEGITHINSSTPVGLELQIPCGTLIVTLSSFPADADSRTCQSSFKLEFVNLFNKTVLPSLIKMYPI